MEAQRARAVGAAAALVCALATLAFATSARAAWSAATPVSPVDDYGQYQQAVAADSRGDGLVAWTTVSGGVGFARRPAGGSFQPPEALHPSVADSPRAAMNDSGLGVIVWREGDGAHGALISGSSAPTQFSVQVPHWTCTAGDVAAGVDAQGDVTVFWTDCGTIYTATRPAGGTFGTPQSIPNPGQYSDSMRATVGADGTKVVVWKDYNGVYASVGTTGSFTTTILDSNNNRSALDYDTQLGVPGGVYPATDARGDAVVAWSQCYSGCTENDVIAATKASGQGFRAPQVLEGMNSVEGIAPTVDPNGNASVAWTGGGVETATASNGVFGARQQVATSPACGLAAATGTDGSQYIVWNEYDGQAEGCQGDVGYEMGVVRPAGSSGFTAPAVLASGGGADMPPVVAAEGTRGAIAAWPRGDLAPDYQQRIEASEWLNDASAPPPPAPTASTDAADAIGQTTATLHGHVNPNGVVTTYHFEWGRTTSYGNRTPASDAAVGSDSTSHAESQSLTGLSPATTYHFRIVATSSAGTTSGSDSTFTTAAAQPSTPPPGSPPSVVTGPAAGATATSAVLNGSLNPNGSATGWHFDWGTTAAYGHATATESAGAGNASQSVSASLVGLSPGTTYHFRLVASNANGTTTGTDRTFMTPPAPASPTGPASNNTADAPGGVSTSSPPAANEPPPGPPFTATLRVRRSTAISRLLSFGVSIEYTCSRPCSVSASLTLGGVRVGAAHANGTSSGVIDVRVTRRGVRALAHRRHARLALRLVARSGNDRQAFARTIVATARQTTGLPPPSLIGSGP